MLTVKPPIQLKSQRQMDTIHHDMEEKIRGNYNLLNGSIRREELLYLTASSPEIYFEEGGITNVLTEINNQSKQEFRLDVINNLMNRILLYHTDNFSYQDSVYISNVLRQLGITNVQEFMKSVSLLQVEQKNNHKLLQLYEENKSLLKQIFHEENLSKEKEIIEKENTEKDRYYLHELIYQRLTTGRVYEDVRNFWQSISENSNTYSRNEMRIAEQAEISQVFKLKNLKTEILQQSVPMYHQHTNQYEFIENEEIQQELQSRVTAAILLNLSEQAYFLRQQYIENRKHSWYSIANALFETAENTWKRFETYHQEGITVAKEVNQNIRELTVHKQEEVQMLNNIQHQYRLENPLWNVHNIDVATNMQQDNIYPQYIRNDETTRNEYQTSNQQLELQYLLADIGETQKEWEQPLTVEEIKEQLRITNEKNVENLKRIQELQKRKPTVTDVKVDKQKAREDALRALENPVEVLQEYLTTERVSRQEQLIQQIEEEYYNLMPRETQMIFRQEAPADDIREAEEIPVSKETEAMTLEYPFREHTDATIPVISREIRNTVKMMKETIQRQNVLNYENTQLIQQRADTYYLEQLAPKETEEAMVGRTVPPEAEEVYDVRQKITENQEYHILATENQEILFHNRMVEIFSQPMPNKVIEQAFQNVTLVHKEEDRIISEDVLNTLHQQTRETSQTETREQRNQLEQHVVETNVQQTVNRRNIQQIENIDEIVQQNVRKQLGKISDQVYGKIEKRLQTERKRRGY